MNYFHCPYFIKLKKKLLIPLILTKILLVFTGGIPIFYKDYTLIKIIALVSIAVISFIVYYLLNKRLTQKIKDGSVHVFGIDKSIGRNEILSLSIFILFFIVLFYFSLKSEKTFNELYLLFYVLTINIWNDKIIFPNLKWQLLIEDGKMYFPSIFKRSRELNNQIEVTDSYGYTFKIKDGDWETEIPKVEGEDSRLKELIAQSGSLEIS
jgi:hypothetical protein